MNFVFMKNVLVLISKSVSNIVDSIFISGFVLIWGWYGCLF